MITPRFQVSQDDATVTVVLRAPLCNLNELDVIVEDEVFIFACKPYYLRLNLPGRIVDDSSRKSSYDTDSGEFTFTYAKALPGEHFKDLDLITKLLCRKVQVNEGSRKIEVLSSELQPDNEQHETVTAEFGFAMLGNYKFEYVNSEFKELFEIDPYTTVLEDRKKLRLTHEAEKFNVDHYISDFIDDEEIQECIACVSPWSKLKSSDISFTPEELDFLKDLPNVAYNLSEAQMCYCHNSLIEILFSYCYDRRTTYFEGTCESGWTISKLCATFSRFDGFTNVKDAVICSFRRSLIYPLYRNFKLSQKVFDDLKTLIQLEQKFLIKCLIEIHNIFLTSDRYILNNLFVRDYIIYVMTWDNDVWMHHVELLNSMIVMPKDLGLSLDYIEKCLAGETDLSQELQKMRINESESSASDSDDLSSDADDESSDSSYTDASSASSKTS